MKNWKKALSLLICSLMLATPLMACGGEEKQENNDDLKQSNTGIKDTTSESGDEPFGRDYYEVPKEFRWVAYSTPPNEAVGSDKYENNPDYNFTDGDNPHWQLMKDCGFNYAQPIHYDYDDVMTEKSLANAEKVGVKVLITSSDRQNPDSLGYISDQGGTYQEAKNKILANETAIKAHYDKFVKYESFAGIFGCDEPSADKFAAIAAAQDWWEINYPKHEFYVNLLPEYASDDQLFGTFKGKSGYKTYADHVARFCEEVNPYIMSYDHYCLGGSGEYISNYNFLGGFFYNLAIGANNAKVLENKYGWEVPFYIYLQSMGFEGKVQPTAYEQWSWQVYNCLAFGVTGIQTFNYWPHLSPDNGSTPITDAIVDRYGKKTKLYNFVQKTISDIASFEDVYLSYDWEHACGWNADGKGMSELMQGLQGYDGFVNANGERVKGFTDIAGINTNQEILIGQFASYADRTQKAYFVSNASDIQAAQFKDGGAFVSKNSYGKAYNVDVTLSFGANVASVKIYKPGVKDENNVALPETVAVSNGKVSFTIPQGEGFFIVPTYA
ncbi:MAG: hypothetical protein E7368_00490 [Clostridiales bacterium]|nr:hypothetical protein [Clostridiales bacterium]